VNPSLFAESAAVYDGTREDAYTDVLRIARGLGCTLSALVEGLDEPPES
jgi:hypothetical protein